MLLNADDFPLAVVGPLIYARTRSSPVLTAATPAIAEQVARVLNTKAREERPSDIGGAWLVRH